jgi:subtilisin family serine protease
VDGDGHGTHVLGIAGGDGSATGGTVPAYTYVGMAPRADLVMVKTDYTDTGILDGVAYVMNRATALGKHAVVNLSLGSQYGPKDGTSPFEAGIAALTGPGRIVVASAGNDGGYPVHAEVTAPGGPGALERTS